jgi:hypothetical protein
MLVKSEITSLLNEVLGQTARLRKGGNEAVYYCLFCHHAKKKLECCLDEHSKYFGVFNCWVCGESGTFYKLAKFSNNPNSYKSRLAELLKNVKLSWSRGNINIKPDDVVLPNEFIPLSTSRTSPEYKNAMVYLRRRGILKEDIFRYNLGYCEVGEYEHHIIIPSYSASGKLNFFIGRRYYDTFETIPFRKPYVSMNIIGFECFINYQEPLVLVEAAFNAITIRNNAIPLFGKYPSQKLLEAIIINHVEKVYVCLDSDATNDSMRVCARLLKLGVTPYLVEIIGGKDPNEVGFEKMRQFIRNAKEIDQSDLLKYKLEI